MTTRAHRAGRFVTKWAGVCAWVFLVVLTSIVFQVQQDQRDSDRRQVIANARNTDASKVRGCENANAFRLFFPQVIEFAAARSPKYDPAATAEFVASYRKQFPTSDCEALERDLTAKRIVRFGEEGR